MVRDVVWNLFLAAIPTVLGYVLAWGLAKNGGKRRLPMLVNLLLAAMWLAFLPNSCYLLTEWRHLLMDRRWDAMLPAAADYHAQMYALAKWASFYLAYSAVGVLLFTLSIRPVEHRLRGSGRKPVLLAPFFFFLVSLGVYMGLIVRLNSWDIVSRPLHVWNTLQGTLVNNQLLVPLVVFAGLLWLLYELVDIWVDAVAAKLGRTAGARGR